MDFKLLNMTFILSDTQSNVNVEGASPGVFGGHFALIKIAVTTRQMSCQHIKKPRGTFYGTNVTSIFNRQQYVLLPSFV